MPRYPLLFLIIISIHGSRYWAATAKAIETFSCPKDLESNPVQVPANVLIRVEKTSQKRSTTAAIRTREGILCTLVRVTVETRNGNGNGNGGSVKKYFAPVARSYDGFDWEKVAGPYSSSLEIKCIPDDDMFCTIQVPPLEVSDTGTGTGVTGDIGNTGTVVTNHSFQLIKYEYNITERDEAARFFEQSTFGTTLQDLHASTESLTLSKDNDDDDGNLMMNYFSTWLHDQMYTVPPTLHRSLWRDNVSSMTDGPVREGTTTHPCEPGARWRNYAFDRTDVGKMMSIDKVNDRYALGMNGHVRTMVDAIDFVNGNMKLGNIHMELPANFEICLVAPALGKRFGILYNGICEETKQGIPIIDLNGMIPEPLYVLELNDLSIFRKKRVKNNKAMYAAMTMRSNVPKLKYDLCSTIAQDGTPVFAKLQNGQTLLFVPYLVLQTNTMEDPLRDGGGSAVMSTQSMVQCSNAPRTFLNDATCQISVSRNACTNIHTGDDAYFQRKIDLSRPNILEFYKITGRYIYAVQNLGQYSPILDFPCQNNAKSRWQRVERQSPCPKYLKQETMDAFHRLIEKSTDPNPLIRDIVFNGICHENDKKRRKFHVEIDGVCWTNIHPEQYNVYDFTTWAMHHPGGEQKIRQFAENQTEFLFFPENHEMWRWYQARDNNLLHYIGRLGDKISIQDLPEYLTSNYTESLSSLFRPFASGRGIVVCGSPGESAGISSMKMSSFEIAQSDVYEPDSFERQIKRTFYQSRKDIWTSIALWSEDQVRQRMAWALSQLLVVGASPFENSLSTEMFTSFYDIFVRNAFGTYKDVLREISFSPMMADMLSYHRSKSQEYNWRARREVQFADENFAREIMQLFSIGSHKLNMDGSYQLDDNGNRILTYTNDEIEEYARAWTGFTRQQLRGNIEEQEGGLNSIDPMKVKIYWRDIFPKMGMDGKYVGDGFMLCSDLPPKSYLRKGATYRLLGNSKISEVQFLSVESLETLDITVIELNTSSKLREKLCNGDGSHCRYKSSVSLDATISCEGIECEFDQIQVVQVAPNVYYEYVKPPCVHHAFFRPGYLASREDSNSICLDPNTAVASAACCSSGSDVASYDTCRYTGERMPLAEAEKRCAVNGGSLCQFKSIDASSCGNCCNYKGLFWSKGGWDGSGRCQIFAVIDTNGKVAIERQDAKMVDYESLTFFRVHWKGDFPKISNECGGEFCSQIGDYCRCRIKTPTNVVFSNVPTKEAVLASLHVGGVPPGMVDYAATDLRNGMKIHFLADSGVYNSDVVFEVTDRFGRTIYLKNVEHIVQMATVEGRPSTEYIFRNPPTFFNAIPEVRDAQYETEAVLDHYLFHQNTAPFLARRFIQRFGQSNPSPRFIKNVAEAFVSGNINVGGHSFGSGKYGDLGAVVAAILLDRESRHAVLDKDPSHGSLREPLLKVVAVMRSMEYAQTFPENVGLYSAKGLLGQMAYEPPNVFSFFHPANMPPGPISRAALVAPEAMVLHKAIGMVNGLLSLVEYGLTSCDDGLGGRCPSADAKHGHENSGSLSYVPPLSYGTHEIVDELCTLLTSGRMSDSNRRIIRDAYSLIYEKDKDRSHALQIAQQLILVSAEFHSTGLTKNAPTKREVDSIVGKKTCKKYKAVVHLLLNGGMDSYNLLVPHSQCQTGAVSYDQYSEIRGPIAIPQSALHQIDATVSSQPCDIFGIHPSMHILKELYDKKDASFVAGIGVLSEPVNKWNYLNKTKTTLFAHDEMLNEVDRLDPLSMKEKTGTLGRLADVLSLKGYHVNKFTVDQDSAPIEGALETSKVVLDTFKGFSKFNAGGNRSTFLLQNAELLNGNVEDFDNVFSDIWSSALYNVRDLGEYYWAQEFSNMTGKFPPSDFGKQFKSISQMIASNECRGSDRDLFALNIPMFDHHANIDRQLPYYFNLVNETLTSFVDEMIALNMWDHVAIVVTSEFGRTLSANSEGGTDHAWSGNSFILSGALDGGKIHGHYPNDLSVKSPLNIGRGRLIPQLPWEALWDPVAQWLGIEDEGDLNHVLPNRETFTSVLLQRKDLFLDDIPSSSGACEGEGEFVSCSPLKK